MNVTRTMVETTRKPAKPTLLRAMSLSVEANQASTLPTADSLKPLSPVVAAIGSVPACDPDARVEPGVEQIGEQIGHDNHRRDDQKHPLHDGVVALLDRVVEQIAEPFVDEQPLYKERPAEDERDGDAQLSKGRKRRVAADVGRGDPALL